MTYNFLVLALLFLLPGLVIAGWRSDLRRVMGLMALASIPFAFTEFLFYPSYWEPRFLFDLADRIGFGIEDLIFVMGLGAFTSTVYAAVFRQCYRPLEGSARRPALVRALWVLAVAFALVALAALLGIAMIYGSVGIMLGVSAAMVVPRRDLIRPALLGGLSSTAVYGGLCLLFGWLIPGVFDLAWHTEKFLDVTLLGIPVEELLYGFGCGVAATVFYPYVWQQRFSPLKSERP